MNQLKFNHDVKLLTVGKVNDYYNFIKNNPNRTWYGVVWCTTEWDVTENITIPCQYTKGQTDKKMMMYSVFYNQSLEDDVFISGFHKPTPRDPILIQLKLSIDNALIKYLAKQKGLPVSDTPQIEMTHGIYPLVSSRMIKGLNLVSQVGAYFFILTPLLSFTVFLNELVREKELRLRQGLSVVGVKHGVYWVSWFLVALVFSAMTSLMLVVSGLACQFDIFWNIPFFMSFLVFFVFSMTMISLAFFVSTLIHTQTQATSMAFTVVLVIIVFELVFSQPDFNSRFFFANSMENNFMISNIKRIFYMFPSFSLSICYGALVKMAARHLDQAIFAWIPGEKYTWSDFGKNLEGKLVDGVEYTMPSPLHSVEMMIRSMLIYLALTWYFDHVISANRGVADPLYFMFTPKFWKSVFGIKP